MITLAKILLVSLSIVGAVLIEALLIARYMAEAAWGVLVMGSENERARRQFKS